MNTKVFLGLAIRIIIVFAVAILMTFAPDELRGFFGDVKGYDRGAMVDEDWVWGVRHYWYLWMCILLFILSAVNAIVGGIKLVNKYYGQG